MTLDYCKVGRPRLHYKDVCKKDMKCFGIDADRWEEMAENRKEWRHAVKEGASKDHAEWTKNQKRKREKRKTKEVDTLNPQSL